MLDTVLQSISCEVKKIYTRKFKNYFYISINFIDSYFYSANNFAILIFTYNYFSDYITKIIDGFNF